MADMWDQLIFIGGDYEWTGVAASCAIRMHELRPAFRRVFGSAAPRPTVSVSVVTPGAGCLAQHDATSEKLSGGPLRARVWAEATPGNASAVCAHVVVINTALTATYAFTANLTGLTLTGQMKAVRMFDPGPAVNVSVDGVFDADFIAPAATNVYRIGCDGAAAAAPDPTELATPIISPVGRDMPHCNPLGAHQNSPTSPRLFGATD